MTWYPILTPKTYYLTPVTVANAGGGWEGVGEHMIPTPVATCGPWSVEELLVLFFTTDMGLWGSGRFLCALCGQWAGSGGGSGGGGGLEYAPKLPMHVDREGPAAVAQSPSCLNPEEVED